MVSFDIRGFGSIEGMGNTGSPAFAGDDTKPLNPDRPDLGYRYFRREIGKYSRSVGPV
jgi:hypothetical protein